ncbi:TetR/AcrR family transcriptional regulator C-terminal domain-containing protein [Actinomadura sp. 9N407]|uniref:TetR/AcrR family transcriptional regulator C-terminal domain-containing protein n=1 Tax=Actinomadura sp. 9N407 TaxID=3375154 RepID=UPI0037AC5E85
MPAPRKFTREQLQTAALDLVDREGLDALTMRSLAGLLGTGPMTIYNYIDGREGLEELVTEAVMSQVSWTEEPSDDWRLRVRVIAEAMWRAVRAHPGTIPLILTRRSLDTGTLRPAEALLKALAGSGRSGTDLLVAFRVVQGLIIGLAQAELAGPLARARGEDAEVVTGRVAGLPPERFSHLIEVARAVETSDAEAEFHAGMQIVIGGLEAAIERHHGAPSLVSEA